MHKSSFKTMDSTMEAYHNANCTDIGKLRTKLLQSSRIIDSKKGTILYRCTDICMEIRDSSSFYNPQTSCIIHSKYFRYHFIPFHLKRESQRAFWENRKFLYNSYQRILIVDKMCWNVSFWIPPVMELSSLWHLALTKQA